MNILIIVESMFGNTAAVADGIAAGLRDRGAQATVAAVSQAPDVAGFDLVCLGAPTHNMGLPTPTSRAQAVTMGATPVASGVAEWLDASPALKGVAVAAFDTAIAGFFSGSAGKRIAQRVRRLGGVLVARETFAVAGTPAALVAGELARAQTWGAALAAQVPA